MNRLGWPPTPRHWGNNCSRYCRGGCCPVGITAYRWQWAASIGLFVPDPRAMKPQKSPFHRQKVRIFLFHGHYGLWCAPHAGNSPVHLVLNSLEEFYADFHCRIIVDAGGVNIGDFLEKAPFRGVDILNTAEQLVKVVEGLIRIFQTLVVQHKALDDILLRRRVAQMRKRVATWLLTL